MINKEKALKLEKYITDLRNRLENKVIPEKHVGRIVEYHQYLSREIEAVGAKLESYRLGKVD